MLTVQHLSYTHPNKELLFSDLSLTINKQEKAALIGHNGVGKSTLLKIIADELQPSAGTVQTEAQPYYIPQIFGQYNHLTIAQALKVDKKLKALHEILNGNVAEENFSMLHDDWTIEDRCQEALAHWGLADLDLSQTMETLSGGQKTKVLLAGIAIHQPELVLLDEPTNHLDVSGRNKLYAFIQNTKSAVMIVSHDRNLLNLLSCICELSNQGINVYGGNYDFYSEQKQLESNALNQDIQSKEKALRKAKAKERETIERQQKSDARAKKNLGKAGLPKIVANTWRNSAERSTAKTAAVHAGKTENMKEELHKLRASRTETDQMKFGFDHSALHKGKKLFIAEGINFSYGNGKQLWHENIGLRIVSGERIAIKGTNGSGKTTLIKIMLGQLSPGTGTVFIAENRSVYIDQDYSLINNRLSVYEQAQQFNTTALEEHEIKIRLNRFLFSQDDWAKPCAALSGGERMRLMLCCLNIGNQSPDIIVLDEPTNNLDIQNIEILTNALNDYQGTLVVVSHDETFLAQIQVERIIEL